MVDPVRHPAAHAGGLPFRMANPRNGGPRWLGDLLTRTEQEMRLKGFSPKTRRLYLGHLKRYYRARGGKGPRCTEEECREWLLGLLDGGYSHSYVSQALSAIKFVHTTVLRCHSPVARLPRPRKGKYLPTVLSRGEVRRLLDELRDPKHRAVALVMYSSGLRIGEALRLRVQDIDSERGLIHVRDGKGRKDRLVMLAQVTLQELRSYARVERPHHWLFPGERRDRHLHPRCIQRAVGLAAKAAGIRKRVTPHTFRHSFATHLLEEGTDLRYIQRLLGHKKSTTTEIYTHVADRDLARIRSPADTLLGGDDAESGEPF
jgi:integrase/recombinase XerD